MENVTKLALGLCLAGLLASGVALSIPVPPRVGPACNYTLTCN